MTECENEIDIAEKIYMSFGDNETDEATEILNQFAESYHAKKCLVAYRSSFTPCALWWIGGALR